MKKRLLTLIATLTFVGTVAPTFVNSAWAAYANNTASSAPKHSVFEQITTSSVQYAAPSVSRRYWVDYNELPRNTAGEVNTIAISNWSINIPNDDREYLYNPSTRQLTLLADAADQGQLPSLLVEMTTNTSSDSVRVCRKGFSFLGFSALRCRESDLANLPIREDSTSREVITSSSQGDDVAVNDTREPDTHNTISNSQTTVDVALRGVDSAILSAGDRIGGFTVTRGWTANHIGTDIALSPQNGRWPDSTGLPIYAIGAPGTKVEVRCWYEPIGGQNASTYSEGMDFAFDFAHLDSCIAGERGTVIVNAGDQIGTIGNTGSASTGPHLHMQQRRNGNASPITGEQVEAWRGYIEIALSGLGTDNVASNR